MGCDQDKQGASGIKRKRAGGRGTAVRRPDSRGNSPILRRFVRPLKLLKVCCAEKLWPSLPVSYKNFMQ